jgi:hypothetical protein
MVTSPQSLRKCTYRVPFLRKASETHDLPKGNKLGRNTRDPRNKRQEMDHRNEESVMMVENPG